MSLLVAVIAVLGLLAGGGVALVLTHSSGSEPAAAWSTPLAYPSPAPGGIVNPCGTTPLGCNYFDISGGHAANIGLPDPVCTDTALGRLACGFDMANWSLPGTTEDQVIANLAKEGPVHRFTSPDKSQTVIEDTARLSSADGGFATIQCTPGDLYYITAADYSTITHRGSVMPAHLLSTLSPAEASQASAAPEPSATPSATMPPASDTPVAPPASVAFTALPAGSQFGTDAQIEALPHPELDCADGDTVYPAGVRTQVAARAMTLAVVSCNGNGVVASEADIYTMNGSTPMVATLVISPDTDTPTGPYPQIITASGDTVTVISNQYAPTDNEAQPSYRVTQHFTLTGLAITVGAPVTTTNTP